MKKYVAESKGDTYFRSPSCLCSGSFEFVSKIKLDDMDREMMERKVHRSLYPFDVDDKVVFEVWLIIAFCPLSRTFLGRGNSKHNSGGSLCENLPIARARPRNSGTVALQSVIGGTDPFSRFALIRFVSVLSVST